MGCNNYLSVSQIQIRIEACWALPERWFTEPFLILRPPIIIGGGFFVFKVFIVNINNNGQKIYKDTFREH